MKIAIGVPTFNRQQFVELHARSLCASRLPSDITIIIIDDVSTDYDVDYLKSVFPQGSEIRRNSKNSGAADFAVRDVLQQLVTTTDADAMIIVDSDMLVAENFLEVGAPLLLQTQGVLSLFNTPAHPAYGSRGPFVLKKTIGSAGSFWRREVAEIMLASVAPGFKWDWRFCAFLTDAGYEICVTRNSLVQHLGFAAGENSGLKSGDYGVGFSDGHSQIGYALIEQAVLSSQSGFRQLLETIASLQTRVDWLQGELNNCKEGVMNASSRLELQAFREETLRGELKEAKSRIEALCGTNNEQQGILRELLVAEGRLSGRIKRLERMLGVRLFDRLSRSLLKRK